MSGWTIAVLIVGGNALLLWWAASRTEPFSYERAALALLDEEQWRSQGWVYDQLPRGSSRDELMMALHDLVDRGYLEARAGRTDNRGTASDRRDYRKRLLNRKSVVKP